MSTKFEFGGHERPFWLTDFPGRIRVTVERNDGPKSTTRRDTFYIQGSTVSQVADAIWQALFGPTPERPSPRPVAAQAWPGKERNQAEETAGIYDRPPKPDEEVVLTLTKSGVYSYHPGLGPEVLPALRQIVGQLERQRKEWLKRGWARDDGLIQGHRAEEGQPGPHCQVCRHPPGDPPSEGDDCEPDYEGPTRDYPEDAISPGE